MGESPLFKVKSNWGFKMKIAKLEIKNWRWYYNSRELANPIVIIWKCIWVIPFFAAIALAGIFSALFNWDIGEIERVWKDNL